MANNNVFTMDFWKGQAIKVYNGMKVVFSDGNISYLNVSEDLTSEFNCCYAINKSKVGFISEKKLFVIPYTRALEHSLSKAKFKRASFYVPFINGESPVNEIYRWKWLCKTAIELQKTENKLIHKGKKTTLQDLVEKILG